MPKEFLKSVLYRSGALGLYHRLRNRRSLTVVSFHRILREDDPRWATCDPDYTLRADAFAASLAFFRRHYNVVSLEQVLDARRGAGRLPPRALLITFDDGWADTAQVALPELQRAGLPAVLFLVADAVGRREPFYQEQLVAAWRAGSLGIEDLEAALDAAGAPHAAAAPSGPLDLARLRAAIERVEAMAPRERQAFMAGLADRVGDGCRHMVDAGDLERLLEAGVAIGAHGKSHVRMTSPHADPVVELGVARSELERHAGGREVCTLSFPHGRYDDGVLRIARDAGYELMFTSVQVLNPVSPRPGDLLGRTGFDAGNVLDAKGRFRPDWLALYLFRPPLRAVS
ncbi:MAG: polysaccharide deacetylase family protein [Gammaproteobacteria bacterium]|jgi:peptidoglycan/xylan/chitin deacetylase (PgdA/CDA1 family)|nr:polysaccharide deacetylase family protein [Gammaproteobacteria bacterium]